MMKRICGVLLVAVAVWGLSGCKGGADVPEPWAKMKLPIGDGEVTPGSNATNLFVKYGSGGEVAVVKGFEGYAAAMAASGCKAEGPPTHPIPKVWGQLVTCDGKPAKLGAQLMDEGRWSIEVTFDKGRF